VRSKADDGQLNLAYGPETKNKKKIKSKTEYHRKNGPGKSPWRQSGRKKYNYGGRGLDL